MRHIPAVNFFVKPSSFKARLMSLMLVLTAAVESLWWVYGDSALWAHFLSAFIWILLAIWVLRDFLRPVSGCLVWNGEYWGWETHNQIIKGQIVPRLDFQRVILLEFKPVQSQKIWLWLEAGQDTSQWGALRRAVWSLGNEPGLPRGPFVSSS